MWELEERQLKEMHQATKTQMKDMFFLQRHHLVIRQEKVSQGRNQAVGSDEEYFKMLNSSLGCFFANFTAIKSLLSELWLH